MRSSAGRSRAFLGLALGAALLGWIGFAVFAFGDPREAARAYLVAFLWTASFPLGALAFLMIHHAVGGRWGQRLAPLMRAAAATTPLLILAFLPLLSVLPQLYGWARPEEVAHTPLWQHRAIYLNPAGFALRGLGAFLIWSFLAWKLRTPISTTRIQMWACAGMAAHLLLTGVLSVDWVLSLEVHFRSSIFGLLLMTLQALTGFSLLVALACLLAAPSDQLYDLGGLLLAQVMLVAYLTFSQLVIIYSGNIPAETEWLRPRVWGAWGGWAVGLLLVELFLPFLLLAWGAIKRDRRKLGAIAGSVTLLSAFHYVWWVVPSFHPEVVILTLAYPAAFLALGSSWTLVFAVFLRRGEATS